MTAIKHALQRDVFTPNNECLLTIVNVCKAGKKKSCFLCVTVTTERPVVAKVVMVKKSDKGDFYKRQMAWELQGLTKVDSKDSSKENPDFDLHFDKVYRWVASSTAEKHAFISCIWRLSESDLRKKVEFVNISSQLMEESVLSSESQSVPGDDKDPLDDYQKLNTREKDIESMMEMCECAISNAEAFAGMLTSELQVLDGAIIQSIMASDNEVNNLMQLLDEALAKVDTIEGKLSSYDEMLQSIKEQMDQMSLSDRLIQTGNTNSSKLLDEIQFLVKYMDLSKEHIMALQEGDLSSPKGIEACINASEALLQCMNIALQPGHDKLMAVTKQQDLFSELRDTFAQRLTNHLNNVFVHQGHNQSSTLSHHTIELTLPKHSPFHRDLLRYTKLMEWLKNTQNEKYEGLSRTYVDYISRLYEREIKHFFEVARIKMASTTKEERVKFAKPSQKQGALKQETESLNASEKLTGSTSSLNKLAVQSSSSSSQSPSLLDVGNMSVSDLDVANHTRFDKIFERILSELYVLCLAEQDFVSNFFKLPQHPAISSPLAQPEMEELDGVVQYRITPQGEHRHSLSSEMDMVCLMNKIFQSIETELNNFIALAVKIDNFHSLYMLVKMNHPVWMAEDVDPASYLGIMLRNVLVTVKRNFDKYISGKIRQMEEVKISKKSKVGILPFVKGFEEFAKLAETIILNTEGQGDVDVAYKKLIKAVFMNVEKVANESQKTPRDVVMMENFHHIFSTLSRLKIISLENEKREAKCKYTDHLQSYVIDSLGQPLVKLNHFFEGVKAHVAQRIHEEEVSYQFAFTKQELRRIIKKYPGKEVKKGLKNLYKKVGIHLCEEEGLLQVVWYSMQDEFIRQYKRFEELIGRCYPDFETTMDFTIQDIQEYFSSIAQSH